MAVVAVAEGLHIIRMNEAELRQWVEANPGRVNDRDSGGLTPLAAVAAKEKGLALVVRLLDEKGADVNATMALETSALHYAKTLDILNALLDHGGDPTRVDFLGWSALMHQMRNGTVDGVARLLQDPRVRATINMQDVDGRTAFHRACCKYGVTAKKALNVHLLLQAGADLSIANKNGQTPMALLRQHRPSHYAAIALLEQAPDAEKSSLLVKARRLVVAAASNAMLPSCLQSRIGQGQPLPRVALMRLAGTNKRIREEREKFRTTIAFLCGMGREAMPRDMFGVVLDFLMLSWDPLRRGFGVGCRCRAGN